MNFKNNYAKSERERERERVNSRFQKIAKTVGFATVFIIGLFLFSGSASAATYYVTQTGAGSGSGADIDNPKSIAGFNAGALSETGGDSIYFLDDFTTGIIPSRDGSVSVDITLRGDYAGRPASVVVSSGSAIDLQSRDYMTIIDIDGESNDTASNTAGLEFGWVTNITIDGGTFKGAWRIAHTASSNGPIAITNSTFFAEMAHYASYSSPIALFGSSSMSGSTFSNLTFDSDYDGLGSRPTNSSKGIWFDGTAIAISDVTVKKWRLNSTVWSAWNFYLNATNSTVTNLTMGEANDADASERNDGANVYVPGTGNTLDNVNVYNAGGYGISVPGASPIVKNSLVEKAGSAGYYFGAVTVDLDDNSSVDNTGQGYMFQGSQGIVDDCTYLNTTGTAGGFVFQAGAIMTLNNCTVTGNRSSSTGHDGFGVSGSSSNITYNNCTAQNVSTDGFSASGASYTCNWCLSINNGNTTQSHWGDGFTAHEVGNITIRNSVAYGNTKSGADFQDLNTDDAVTFILQNNTFYNNGDGFGEDMGIGFGAAGMSSNDTFIVQNNILANNYGYPILVRETTVDPADWTADNNLFYETSYTYTWNGAEYNFADWKTNSGGDANSAEGNPLFMTTGASPNLNLQSISPAIDAGEDVNISTDYAGNSRYDMPSIANTGSAGSYSIDYTDIGAYEYIMPPDPTLSCSTHPAESTWYNSISPVTMTFATPYDTALKATTTDFKYLINQTLAPSASAIQAGTALNDLVTFNAASSITADGTWYIHSIAQNEATTTVYSSNYDTYTIKYDATAPSISLSSPVNNNSSSLQPTFTWSGSDSSSGIAYYQLYIDSSLNTDNITGVSSSPSSTLSCGAHTWYVKAIDNAGNSANSSTYNLIISCGSTPVSFLQQINQQPALTPTPTEIPTQTPTTGGTANTSTSNTPATIEQILSEAKIVDLADVNNIAAEASAARDINTEINYDKTLITKISSTAELAALTKEDRVSLTGFISYGTKSTKNLGASERAGVINSFKSAFGKLPAKEADWSDVIKIANGRWPTQRSKTAEDRAKTNFKIIYKREPNRKNSHDDAAITVMAYGLRPAKRNLGSEKAAIKIFKAIFGYNPVKATAWDAVRAIAYSGATR